MNDETEERPLQRLWIQPRHPGGRTPRLDVLDFETRARIRFTMSDVYRMADACQDLIEEYEEWKAKNAEKA